MEMRQNKLLKQGLNARNVHTKETYQNSKSEFAHRK